MLVWSMKHRLAISLIAIVTILSIVPFAIVTGKDFIPQDDQSQFEVNVRAPEGTSLQGSKALVEQLEGDLRSLPGLDSILTTVGADSQQRVNYASLFVQLVPIDKRKETQVELMQQSRRLMSEVQQRPAYRRHLPCSHHGRWHYQCRLALHCSRTRAGSVEGLFGKDSGSPEEHSRSSRRRHHSGGRETGIAGSHQSRQGRRPRNQR